MDSTPINSALIRINEAFQEEIITPGGLKLFMDGTYNRNYTATVTGTIAALPIQAKTAKEKRILDSLKIGDEICMSYLVVYDLDYASDGDQFMETSEGNDMMRSWHNGKGEKLNVVALPGKIAPLWTGYYLNKYNQLVDGVQGNQSAVERWLSQFSLGKTDKFTFNNLLDLNGQAYWKCDLELIFAKKHKGHLKAVGDNVICQPIEEDIPAHIRYDMGKLDDSAKIRYADRGLVLTSGSDKFKKGEIVAFNPMFLQRYDFWNKSYYLMDASRIQGKFVRPPKISRETT